MTKTDKKSRFRKILDRYGIGDSLSSEDTAEVSTLLGYHFREVKRCAPLVGTGIAIVVNCPALEYVGRWSWVKSIDGYDDRKNMLQAMRKASRKGTFAKVRRNECVACGAMTYLSVDHKTTPFVRICESYVAEFGTPRIENRGDGWTLCDEKQFIRFHDEIADYQVLCVSCNAKKGSGDAYEPQ